MDSFKSAKRGGFIYTATLLLFLAVSLIGKTILNAAAINGTVYYAVSSLFSVAVLIVAVIFGGGKSIKSLFLNGFSYKHILFALFLAFGMFMGLGFINLAIEKVIIKIGGVVPSVSIPLENAWQFVLFSVLLCLFPAFFEESFFRGVLLNGVNGSCKTRGVFTVALCFALFHLSAVQFIYQFIYGVGLAVLTLKAKSVIPAVIAHFINNFIILTVEFFSISVNLFDPFIIAAGIVLLGVFTLFMFFPRENKTAEQSRTGISAFYLPFGALGIAAAVFIIVMSTLPL